MYRPDNGLHLSQQSPSEYPAHPTEGQGRHLLNLPREMLDAIIECITVPGSQTFDFSGLGLTNKFLNTAVMDSIKRTRMNGWMSDLCGSEWDRFPKALINGTWGLSLHFATWMVLGTLPPGFENLDCAAHRGRIAYKVVLMFACLALSYRLDPDTDVEVLKAQQYWVACRCRKACWYMDGCNRMQVERAYKILTRRLQSAGVWVKELAWEDLPSM